MLRLGSCLLLAFLLFGPAVAHGQLSQLDQIQVAPPMPQVQPPSPTATAEELEQQADELRSQKAYLDAIDYFEAAIKRSQKNTGALYNKLGISELMLQRYHDAEKHFKEAIKKNRDLAEAYNNLGAVYYERRKYSGAIKNYKKALSLSESASFYSNLGAAYFAKKKFEDATHAYAKAVQIDPTIFENSSRTGIAAQLASPQDRAHYDYVLAKLFAKMGNSDRSLEYLRKAMEGGYKNVTDALRDPEFAVLRKDARFTELMKERPQALPE